MFRKIILFLLLFNISFVFADSLVINNEITQFYYNVSFTENLESKITENRQFTYYPNYTQNAMPTQGLISGLITILIIIGGLFL